MPFHLLYIRSNIWSPITRLLEKLTKRWTVPPSLVWLNKKRHGMNRQKQGENVRTPIPMLPASQLDTSQLSFTWLNQWFLGVKCRLNLGSKSNRGKSGRGKEGHKERECVSGRVHLISKSFIFNTRQLPCSPFDLRLPGFIAMHRQSTKSTK